MSTTSTAIYSNPLFVTYSVYARNASIVCLLAGLCKNYSADFHKRLHVGHRRNCQILVVNPVTLH